MSIDKNTLDTPEFDSDISLFQNQKFKQVWAIGGGKGGVGKSLISANLAITLAQLGYKVTAVDLDLGCANLHTCLGVDIPQLTLSDFFSKRVSTVSDVVVPTAIKNLNLISGAQDSIGVANLKHTLKSKLLSELSTLDADYLILDLGAGTAYNTLDFFLAANIGILVLLPEPTSIENTYRFIKSAYYRKLKLSENLSPIRSLIEMAMDQKNEFGIRSPADLFKEASKMNPEIAAKLKEEIQSFKPKLVINQARTQSDIDIGFSIKSVCKKYFGIDMDYIGYLDYDSAVWQSVRKKKPVCIEFPNSKLASSFQKMARYLLQDTLKEQKTTASSVTINK
jgi:flagellar biosynthesis protein FlhG